MKSALFTELQTTCDRQKMNIPTPKKALVALTTYNEIENLPSLVESILSTMPDADVLIVDDNSPDGTGVWALEASRKDARIHCIVRVDERGLGSAVVVALRYAIERNYRYVVNMDADFSHPVAKIPELVARVEKSENEKKRVDVAIGSRYVKGGSTVNWPLKRRLSSRLVNFFARLTLGLNVRDASGSFRCYRVDALRNVDFSQFLSSGYSFFEETLFRLQQTGAAFEEIPIAFVERRFGSSKINRKEAIRAVYIMSKLGVARCLGRFALKTPKKS